MLKKLIAAVLTLGFAFIAFLPALISKAAAPNLIPNPSVELNNGTLPNNWRSTKSGTNTATFSYLASGHDSTHSLKTQVTKYSSGHSAWMFDSVAVKPSTKYTYREWYQATVPTAISVVLFKTNGSYTVQKSATQNPSIAWKQSTMAFTTPSDVTSVTIEHTIYKIGQLVTDDFSLEGPTAVAPTVSLTAPVNGAVVKATQALSATATNAVGVQFKVDGVNIGAEDTTAPYSVNWDPKATANGPHVVTATARSADGITATSTSNITVANPSAPTVSISAPLAGATVSGSTVAVSANASDAQGIKNVQFKLDGSNLGAADTTAPYGVNWNTTSALNGSHTLSAVVTNTVNLTATAPGVVVNVQNTTPPPPSTNLIPNPSLETASGNTPASWLSSNWGTNTATFSYLSTGHTGSHSAKVDISSYTDGAANWYYADIPVASGKTYKYENWYQSNVDTEVDAEIVMNDGSIQYAWLGTVFANTNWTKFSTTFTVPAGAKSMAIYQIIAKKGYVITDDYSLSEYTPAALTRGLVSVTFDDGWVNQYTNALPLLQKYGIKGTFYIISGELTTQPEYMSGAQVKNLFSLGNEIGSHSVTHPDLTTLSQANLVAEMSNSKTTLQNLIVSPITDFAYPLGAYNANTIATGKQYYTSQRTVDRGFNSKDNFDITKLKIQEVDSDISQAQVNSWVNQAIAEHTWLILVYHEIANSPIDPTDALYTTKPTDLDAELSYIKNSGVTTLNVNQAINEILSQL